MIYNILQVDPAGPGQAAPVGRVGLRELLLLVRSLLLWVWLSLALLVLLLLSLLLSLLSLLLFCFISRKYYYICHTVFASLYLFLSLNNYYPIQVGPAGPRPISPLRAPSKDNKLNPDSTSRSNNMNINDIDMSAPHPGLDGHRSCWGDRP